MGIALTIFSKEVSQSFFFAGWGPYAYFEELELCTNEQAANAVGVADAQAAETQSESRVDERSGIGCMGLTLSPTSGRSPQDVESRGR